MSNLYEVLGKAPTPDDLKKLSPNEVHLTIKNLNAGYGKMEILHNFDLFVNKARTELRNQNKPLDSVILSKYLDKYAETGSQYIEVLQKIIEQNNLKDFDEARLLPSSKDLESLI